MNNENQIGFLEVYRVAGSLFLHNVQTKNTVIFNTPWVDSISNNRNIANKESYQSKLGLILYLWVVLDFDFHCFSTYQ